MRIDQDGAKYLDEEEVTTRDVAAPYAELILSVVGEITEQQKSDITDILEDMLKAERMAINFENVSRILAKH